MSLFKYVKKTVFNSNKMQFRNHDCRSNSDTDPVLKYFKWHYPHFFKAYLKQVL